MPIGAESDDESLHVVKIRRRTETSIETHEVLVVRRATQTAPGWCSSCASEVRFLTVDEVAAVAATSARTVYRWVEADAVHFIETDKGRLLICMNSLPQ